jgi:hypothetical protein
LVDSEQHEERKSELPFDLGFDAGQGDGNDLKVEMVAF